LMDKLLETCGSKLAGEQVMDSNVHERERGITITSKYTRLYYKDYALHVVDTPGHADFGGEVERILHMVDGVVLLVDASEGPMSQTKFVLSKALAVNKPAIVVLNKVDREGHRAEEVETEILDLFCALTNDDHLLDYPLMFASSKQGWVTNDITQIPGKEGVIPLLEAIIARVPPPNSKETLDEPFALGVNTIQTDTFLGRIVTGKVEAGKVSIGDPIKVMNREGVVTQTDAKVSKLFYLEGLERVEVEHAFAGEIVSLAGSSGAVADTGETLYYSTSL
jgi:GTP-binding protein